MYVITSGAGSAVHIAHFNRIICGFFTGIAYMDLESSRFCKCIAVRYIQSLGIFRHYADPGRVDVNRYIGIHRINFRSADENPEIIFTVKQGINIYIVHQAGRYKPQFIKVGAVAVAVFIF